MSVLPLSQAVLDRCRADRSELVAELHSYEPRGVMRLWRGRSMDRLREVTGERVVTLQREIAIIDALIEFAEAVEEAL
jgi:hypothetical protein